MRGGVITPEGPNPGADGLREAIRGVLAESTSRLPSGSMRGGRSSASRGGPPVEREKPQ